NRERPALTFLDIIMPGVTGVEVLERLDHETAVIFTTAHDQYAVTAFELGALDYVLKPFSRDRLERAIHRAIRGGGRPSVPLVSRAREGLTPTDMLSKIFVRDGDRIVPLPVPAIERVQGADDYVTIVSAPKEYLVRVRLTDLEAQLTRAGFLRIHRSHLVNLDYIASIESCDPGRLEVVMKSGAHI